MLLEANLDVDFAIQYVPKEYLVFDRSILALLALGLLAPSVLAGQHDPPATQGQVRPEPASLAGKEARDSAEGYLGLSVEQLRAKLGTPDAITGYETFSWSSSSKAFSVQEWDSVGKSLYRARADTYFRKLPTNELMYHFRVIPDSSESRFHPVMRVSGYQIQFDKPVPLRELLSVLPELAAVASEPALLYEGETYAEFDRNTLVVQHDSEVAKAISRNFKSPDESANIPADIRAIRYGIQYQLWFVGGVGVFSATGDSRVERIVVSVGPIGKALVGGRPVRAGEARELPSLGSYFSR